MINTANNDYVSSIKTKKIFKNDNKTCPYHTEKCFQKSYQIDDKFLTIQVCPFIFDCDLDLMILMEFDLPENPSNFFRDAINRFSILEKNKLKNIKKYETFHFVGNIKNLLVFNYNTKSNERRDSYTYENDIFNGINDVIKQDRIDSIVFTIMGKGSLFSINRILRIY